MVGQDASSFWLVDFQGNPSQKKLKEGQHWATGSCSCVIIFFHIPGSQFRRAKTGPKGWGDSNLRVLLPIYKLTPGNPPQKYILRSYQKKKLISKNPGFTEPRVTQHRPLVFFWLFFFREVWMEHSFFPASLPFSNASRLRLQPRDTPPIFHEGMPRKDLGGSMRNGLKSKDPYKRL